MKTVLFLVFLLCIQVSLSAQEKEEQIDLKEYFLDAEYFIAQEEYTDALQDYLEVYNNGYNENANINYRIGICFLNIPGQKDKSIDYLLQALKSVSPKYKESSLKQTNAPVDAYLYLGNAYRVNNMLDSALACYAKYKELAGASGEIKYADQQILACNRAMQFMSNPLPVRITDLGDSINGNSSNFKAVVSEDGLTMAYMNELPFYTAVYVSRYAPSGWTAPVNITPQIQSDGDQYVTSISSDGTRLLLTREDAFNSDIYFSVFQNGKWSKSEPLAGQDINTKYWESHASVSHDGKTLYLASNRKGSLGEMDIYKSKLQSNGEWGVPVNLGNVINTDLNEDTPFITQNDSILFFSSQGHDNMGGYDIFRSKLDASGQWSAPENIRYPLNTTDDDLFYYPWHNARVMYASLIRPDGHGKEDIYAIQPADDMPLAELLSDILTPAVNTTVAVMPQNAPQETATKPVEPEEKQEAVPSPEPSPAPAGADVTRKPVAEPLLVRDDILTSLGKLEPTPVYFAFDHAQVTPEGEVQLEKLYRLMTDYPDIRIRLIGHADAKGPAEYNLGLSARRANNALQYLVKKGIETGRLASSGIGEKNFVAINTNPDGTDNSAGRQLNRRVEYEIISRDNEVIPVKAPPVPENLRPR